MTKKKTAPKKPKTCGAKLRGKDARCRKPPIKGMKRCRLHGGKTPSGTASPHWKTGRYSRHLPRDLRERYLEHLHDEKFHELTDEIALLTSNIGETVQDAADMTAPANFTSVKKLVHQARAAVRNNDPLTLRDTLDTLVAAVDYGVAKQAAWDTIADRIETRRKLVDTQRKYDLETGKTLSVVEAHSMIATIAGFVKEACDRYLDAKLSRTILSHVNSNFEQVFFEPVEVRARR
jgi:hypothetical protein